MWRQKEKQTKKLKKNYEFLNSDFLKLLFILIFHFDLVKHIEVNTVCIHGIYKVKMAKKQKEEERIRENHTKQ